MHFAVNQHMFANVEKLKTLLSQLEEPINRSAARLEDLHDNLRSEYTICSITLVICIDKWWSGHSMA